MLRRVGLPVLVCLVSLAGALPPAGASTSAASSTQASATTLSPGEFARRLLVRINARRVNRGCREYRSRATLVLAAQRHTDAMVARNQLSHQLPGEADLGTRFTRAGYLRWRIAAENIAWGQTGPRAVFRDWVASPGHRANLDDCRLRDIGIDVAFRDGRPWVTADFGRRRT